MSERTVSSNLLKQRVIAEIVFGRWKVVKLRSSVGHCKSKIIYYSSREIDHSHLPFVCISRRDGGAGNDSRDLEDMIATGKTSIVFQTYKTEMK